MASSKPFIVLYVLGVSHVSVSFRPGVKCHMQCTEYRDVIKLWHDKIRCRAYTPVTNSMQEV